MSERLKKNLRFALPAFLIGFMLCTVGELGQLYQQKELFVLTDNNRTMLADFNSFYNAALLSRNHHEHGTPIYDFDVQTKSLNVVTAPVKADPPMLSVYPPQFFLFLEPLCLVPIYPAWLIWSLLTVLVAVASIFLLDLKTMRHRYDRICCAVALLCNSTTFSNFRLGQNSFFLLASMLLVWRLLEAKKYFLAGLATMLCMFKPQYLPTLVTAGAIVGKVRFLAGTALAALIVGTISLISFGLDTLKAWPSFVKLGETNPDVSYAMQNIRGQITILTGGGADKVSPSVLGLFVFMSVAFTAWIWLQYRNQLSDLYLFRLLAGLTVTTALFCSPHTHVQDYALFFGVAGIWTWNYIQNLPAESRPGKVLITLLLVFPFISWFFLVLQQLFVIVRVQPFFLYALTIFLLSLKLLLRTAPALRQAAPVLPAPPEVRHE